MTIFNYQSKVMTAKLFAEGFEPEDMTEDGESAKGFDLSWE